MTGFEEGAPRRREAMWLALVVAAALTARLSYLAELDRSPYYYLELLKGQADSYRYWVWAERIAGGDWAYQGENNQSPLYPYFLALIFRLGGGLPAARLIQVLLGSATAGLAWSLGRRLAGQMAGVIAGLGVAFYGVQIFFDAAILRDGMLCFLNLALVAVLTVSWGRPGPKWGALLGLLFGLALVAKPNIAVMLPVLGLWLWVPRQAEKKLSRAGLAAAGFAAGLILVIAPLAMRNCAAGLPPLMISPQGALEFITGNHPDAPPNG